MAVQKRKVSKIYNKKIQRQSFQEGDLMWKILPPIGAKDKRFGKWSPNWVRPFQLHQVLKGNAYWLASLIGESHQKAINGKYLKYFPIIWEVQEKSEEES